MNLTSSMTYRVELSRLEIAGLKNCVYNEIARLLDLPGIQVNDACIQRKISLLMTLGDSYQRIIERIADSRLSLIREESGLTV